MRTLVSREASDSRGQEVEAVAIHDNWLPIPNIVQNGEIDLHLNTWSNVYFFWTAFSSPGVLAWHHEPGDAEQFTCLVQFGLGGGGREVVVQLFE